MERLKKIGRLRKGWKILGAAILASVVFGGVIIYANAASSAIMKLNVSSVIVLPNSESSSLYIEEFRGVDENHIDTDNPDNNNKLIPTNVEWVSANNNIVTFKSDSTSTSTGFVDKVYGLQPVLCGANAGETTVTATYYSKTYNEQGAITSSTAVNSVSANVVVPLDVKYYDSYNNTPKSTIYMVGDVIQFEANTDATNKLFIETRNDKTGELSNDGVVELVSKTNNSATIKVVGGGCTYVTVRTVDGDGKEQLSRTYQIRAAVELDYTKTNAAGHRVLQTTLPSGATVSYMVLDQTDYAEFTYEEIPSNIRYPATSGVTFKTLDSQICSISAGSIRGEHSGVVKVQAGLYSKDVNDNETRDTGFDINIVVPFKKLGNNVTTMNVSDQIQLTTTSKEQEVTWSTSDNTILQVDATTGMVTAVGAGTAKIYATRTQDELYTVYGLPCQLVYEITVIDGFGLSTTEASVNIGESITLEALVTTSDIEKNPVTFKVENQPGADGVIPTETLVTTSQSGKVLTITGVASGTVRITATQNVNGVLKSEICVVYVTTPVNEITINPDTIQIDRGKTGTVQLLFNPPGPTNSNVRWGTSNPNVATVEGDSYTATIKGVAGGTATISVISEDGLKVATCEVYVREPVTGIALNATTVESTMAIGKYQLVATINPAGEGVNRNVTWSSSDTSVCTVDENGLVTYKKPGYATIVCKTEDGAFIATCNFIISIPVTNIKLDYTDEIMSIGGRLRITAEVLPVEASDKNLYWESSNTNVCIVDSNGLVEAVGTGSCTILCKSADGGYTAMCNIYVKQPVTSIVLNTTDITVRKGQVFWLNATCLPENADNKIVSWESRDESVCKVEADGKVTATGAGTTSIIATNVDTGLTAYCVVTVTQPVTGITLNSDYQLLWVGAKYAIIPNIEPIDAENKNVTYMSSDPTVASVDEYGVVTALKGGSCVIEVTTEECHLTAACTIEVKEYVTSVKLSENFKFLNIGASGTLTVQVGSETATNKNIIWSSSNNEICSVDQEGNLIAGAIGTAVITATAVDGSGVNDTCVVRVVNPVRSISVEPSTLRLLVGESKILEAKITPDDATIKDVDWSSSDEKIAVVDEAGEVFALSPGKVKITATSKDGNEVKGVCWVYVTPVVNITSLNINSSEIYMLTGKSRQLSVRVRPAVNTDSYTWYSSDTGIVVVDQSGVITTVGPGVAEVYVESTAGGVLSKCIVHAVSISRSSITLEQYDSYWLDIIGTDEKVTWRSSNPRVCTVSSTGQVIARKAGTTTVTAVVYGKTLTCVVKVTNIPE